MTKKKEDGFSMCTIWFHLHVYKTGGTTIRNNGFAWATLKNDDVCVKKNCRISNYFLPDSPMHHIKHNTTYKNMTAYAAAFPKARVFFEFHAAPPSRLNVVAWRTSTVCTSRCKCLFTITLREPKAYYASYYKARAIKDTDPIESIPTNALQTMLNHQCPLTMQSFKCLFGEHSEMLFDVYGRTDRLSDMIKHVETMLNATLPYKSERFARTENALELVTKRRQHLNTAVQSALLRQTCDERIFTALFYSPNVSVRTRSPPATFLQRTRTP